VEGAGDFTEFISRLIFRMTVRWQEAENIGAAVDKLIERFVDWQFQARLKPLERPRSGSHRTVFTQERIYRSRESLLDVSARTAMAIKRANPRRDRGIRHDLHPFARLHDDRDRIELALNEIRSTCQRLWRPVARLEIQPPARFSHKALDQLVHRRPMSRLLCQAHRHTEDQA